MEKKPFVAPTLTEEASLVGVTLTGTGCFIDPDTGLSSCP
jgi:hypothetical protein